MPSDQVHQLLKQSGHAIEGPLHLYKNLTRFGDADAEKVPDDHTLPPFPTIANEKELEDWVDKAVEETEKKYFLFRRICNDDTTWFYDKWKAASNDRSRKLLLDIKPLPATVEGLVDKIALVLFPTSAYIYELELEVLNGRQAHSGWEACVWFTKTLTRFYRLRKRWDYPVLFTEPQLIRAFRRCLPEYVLRDLLGKANIVNWTLAKWTSEAWKVHEDELGRPYD
eukprot:Blabericola_migrator_1__4269@NODE_2308_length_2961_cov_146_284727_g1445_i0_p2_GENE_NODE_2308_length_2961_cov_146_284727_g1445_i0NODE_2308_length_2961_cov_146_284727_g1445_i0_p2_ORF_typecomplete_len225_score30_77_NODE_2308_length_2961_cov_146_284727_g1445_i054728